MHALQHAGRSLQGLSAPGPQTAVYNVFKMTGFTGDHATDVPNNGLKALSFSEVRWSDACGIAGVVMHCIWGLAWQAMSILVARGDALKSHAALSNLSANRCPQVVMDALPDGGSQISFSGIFAPFFDDNTLSFQAPFNVVAIVGAHTALCSTACSWFISECVTSCAEGCKACQGWLACCYAAAHAAIVQAPCWQETRMQPLLQHLDMSVMFRHRLVYGQKLHGCDGAIQQLPRPGALRDSDRLRGRPQLLQWDQGPRRQRGMRCGKHDCNSRYFVGACSG